MSPDPTRSRSAPRASLRVAIAMATCDRPTGLDRALKSLMSLVVPEGIVLELVVIDNAADAGAAAAVHASAAVAPWPVHYLHEPVRGLVRVRNAALDWARMHRIDALAMLDDDERADERWLVELVDVAIDTGAEVVIGAVRWDTDQAPPWWLSHAFELEFRGAPDRSRLGTGDGYTGNALVRLDREPLRTVCFRDEFDHTGGEDTQFFDDVIGAGGSMVYAVRAITHERFESERTTLRWWLRRWFRTGNTTGVVELATHRASRLGIALSGFLRVGVGLLGTLATLLALARRRPAGLRFVRMVCRGLGYIAAAGGVHHQEYRQEVPTP